MSQLSFDQKVNIVRKIVASRHGTDYEVAAQVVCALENPADWIPNLTATGNDPYFLKMMLWLRG